MIASQVEKLFSSPELDQDPGDCDLLISLFRSVRSHSRDLVKNLSDADATAQSMEDASPAKWHLAHTSWFFETFLLRDNVTGYQVFDDRYAYLFNSYYESEGDRHARPERGLLTRPSLDEILAYRAHVDAAMVSAMPEFSEELRALAELGINHEQQHQELLLTDILHLFSRNPMKPACLPDLADRARSSTPEPLGWITGSAGIHHIGHDDSGFAFDCEGPRHEVLLTPFELADRPITNGEWLEFIADGGYRDPLHWLADGWTWVKAQNIDAPLYWSRPPEAIRSEFGLAGNRPLDMFAPVQHISLYEADAYASWAGARLPTEMEWEVATKSDLPCTGQVWEWTGSAYRPYPGFKPAKGAVGEYNGKFMSGQFVLRGGSIATPPGHVRSSYRNFFYPHQRWQFTGMRLARDI